MLHANRPRPRAASAALALALAVLCAALGPGAAHGHGAGADAGSQRSGRLPAQTETQLQEARRATRAFRDVEAAKAAGYERASACEDDPKYGAMGVHYLNPALVADGRLDVSRPELLVYQPGPGGKLRLGAIEYFQADGDQDLATDPDRPELFGMPFDGPMLGHNPRMPIHYDLHVWLYRHNPAGLFAMWNPGVDCPDEPGGATP